MAETYGQEPQYRTVRQREFTGVADWRDPTAIEDGESPRSINIEFDRGSIATSKGSRKFNNQTAPYAGIRTRASNACPPLPIEANKSVPLRGAGYLPYSPDYDFGGTEAYEGTFPTSDTYHVRRGRSFEIGTSFRIPMEERLFDGPTKGSGAPATPDALFNPPHGYDEALDECFCIVQKGGDRLAMMSWALAVVNVGALKAGDGSGVALPEQRPSNYALCFIWYDAPSWGERSPASMMYNLTSGFLPTDTGNGATYSTQAYRAIVIHKFVEPGKNYSVKVQLSLDTGSQGAAATNTDWDENGSFRVWVKEETKAPQMFWYEDGALPVLNGLEVWKGPTDSIEYLVKYGVRFFGRDAMFLGLGYRFHPWRDCGFVPCGADAAPLENGGFRMIDRSANTVASLFAGSYTLGFWKTNLADTYFSTNFAGLSDNNNGNGIDPMAVYSGGAYSYWVGLGNAAGALPFNAEALRGYRLVTTADFTPGAPDAKGAVFSILTYARAGVGDFRVTVQGATSIGAFSAGPNGLPMLVQCFRWHQRDLIIGSFSIFSSPRGYHDNTNPLTKSRRLLSIGRTLDPSDGTEPDIGNMLACWRLDDSGGAVLRESVSGGTRNGFLIPLAAPVVEAGDARRIFLSGEGEALALDLSSDPVVKRELEAMLRSGTQGFAIQIACVFTEAFYGIQKAPEQLPNGTINGSRARFAPVIASWDVKGSESTGQNSRPRPILSLTTRQLFHDGGNAKFARPLAFGVEVAALGDNNDTDPIAPPDLLPWYLNAAAVETARYDTTAPWVGKRVVIQVGVQSTGVADQYDVYIAMSPKDAFLPQSGDPGDAEFAYWTAGGGAYDASVAGYYTAAHITLDKKDILRSIVTIGGAYTPNGLGYSELNARMLVEDVRVFATSAPGNLPATNGGITSRDGKLEGTRALPPRRLSADDLRLPLGRACDTVNVTAGSTSVTPSGSTRFYSDEPKNSIEACKGALLEVSGDEIEVPNQETVFERVPALYHIASVAANGTSLTLSNTYQGATRSSARASMLRVIGYTDFSDAAESYAMGSRSAYDPGASTSAAIQYVPSVAGNAARASLPFDLRVFSPGQSTADLLPEWTRGCEVPRRGHPGDGITGLFAHNTKLYATTRGSLYEVDDRWRMDAPIGSWSLAFRAAADSGGPVGGITLPEQSDRIEFSDASALLLNHGTSDANASVFDAWIKLDDTKEYQTVLWVGDLGTDPANAAGQTGSAKRVHVILRMNRGRPELVFGSTAYYTGTTQPEKGLFIATGSSPVQEAAWVHVRWYLETRASGTILKKPQLKVNGKAMSLTVNATDNDASITQATDWLRTSTLIAFQHAATWTAVVGASHDAYRVPGASAVLGPGGVQLTPQRVQGFLHGLGGSLADLRFGTMALWSGTSPADFVPDSDSDEDITDSWRILGMLAEGRGVKVEEHESLTNGVILSHPFISLYHELGLSTDPASFAAFGEQLYVTTGAAPVVIFGGKARPAGIQPPLSAMDFTTEREPIWAPNSRPGTGENDPVDGAAAGVQPLVYHYRASGNNYLEQDVSSQATAVWQYDSTTPAQRYFGFKCYLRPKEIAGRRLIWRKADADKSGGPIVEMRDGHLWLGWHDHTTKRTAWCRSSKPMFKPGHVHYLNIRKGFPRQDTAEGNWMNSYWTGGNVRRMTVTGVVGTFQVGEQIQNGAVTKTARIIKTYAVTATTTLIEYYQMTGADFAAEAISGVTSLATANTPAAAAIRRPMHDIAVVRQFQKASGGGTFGELDAKPLNAWVGTQQARACISMSSDYGQSPSGTTATGIVSVPVSRFTGNGFAGIILSDLASVFHPDMLGMFFQWSSASGYGSTIYRVIAYNAANSIQVANLDGSAAPAWAAATYFAGGVFHGVGLVKEADFNSSKVCDTAPTKVQMFGSPETLDSIGYVAFVGDIWCPAWTMMDGTASEDGRPFENFDTSRATGAAGSDPLVVGTDEFVSAIYEATELGELHADDNRVLWGADLQTYAGAGGNVSTQPSTGLAVPKDTSPVCVFSVAGDPVWKWIQDPEVWSQTQWLAVCFYDPEQGAISNPGPILQTEPVLGDAINPSGSVGLKLSRLPISSQPGAIEARIFKSLSSLNDDGTLLSGGSSAVQNQVGSVSNGTDDFVVRLPDPMYAGGALLQFDNGAPPRCSLLATAQGRIFAGGLVEQPDGIAFSKAFTPWAFPAVNNLRVSIGPGDRVTGMAEIGGLLIAMMRDGVFAVSALQDGAATLRVVTGTGGCIAPQSLVHQDDSLFWLGGRGIYGYSRSKSNTDLGEAMYASEKVKRFFATSIDTEHAFRASATIHRARNQYLVAVKRPDAALCDQRVAFNGDRFWMLRGPNVTALASFQREAGGAPALVGGTEEGFVVWLDDDSTDRLLLGDEAQDGASALTVAAASDAATLAVSGALDTDLEGARGSIVRWAGGEATVLGAEGSYLHLETEITPPAASSALALGGQEHSWESKWHDFGNLEKRKRLIYVDLEFTPGSTGTIDLFWYLDRVDSVAKHHLAVPVGSGKVTIPVDIQGNWFKLQVESSALTTGGSWAITGIAWRLGEIDQN